MNIPAHFCTLRGSYGKFQLNRNPAHPPCQKSNLKRFQLILVLYPNPILPDSKLR